MSVDYIVWQLPDKGGILTPLLRATEEKDDHSLVCTQSYDLEKREWQDIQPTKIPRDKTTLIMKNISDWLIEDVADWHATHSDLVDQYKKYQEELKRLDHESYILQQSVLAEYEDML